MHHVRAFSLGGETTTRNLVALCEPCNQGEGTMFNPEFTDLPLGDFSMVGPDRKDNWHQELVHLSSDLMFTRCEVF
jgi:5-methylcytosine-specific restriction endonuclease McrA